MKRILQAFLIAVSGIANAQIIDAGDTVIFDLSMASCIGPDILVPVSFSSDNVVYAIDFSMKYDITKITYNAVITHLPLVNASAYYNPSDSTLRFSSFCMSPIPPDTPVVSIRFNRMAGTITQADFNTVLVYLNGDVCSFKIIPPSPAAVIIPGGSLTIVSGDSVALTAPSGNGFSYLWSTSDTTQTIYVAAAGVYAVTVITAGGCTSIDSVTVLMSTPLPVDLINFSAVEEHGRIFIQWTTASEINNDFFEVERSNDGVNWHSIFSIEGAGNSASVHHYSEIDEFPVEGINYYRLQQVDFDGTSAYSEIVALNFLKQKRDPVLISVFPNPANSHLNISAGENIFVQLVDVNGKAVFQPRAVHANLNLEISIQQIPSGVYSFKIYRENNGFSERDISVIVFH